MNKILLVDDDATIVFAFQCFFKKHGFFVQTASHLMDALSHINSGTYDLLVTDLSLGGGSGREGLKLIRFGKRKQSLLKTVLMTAYAATVETEQIRKAGTDTYVIKPVTTDTMLAVVTDLLKARPDLGAFNGILPENVLPFYPDALNHTGTAVINMTETGERK